MMDGNNNFSPETDGSFRQYRGGMRGGGGTGNSFHMQQKSKAAQPIKPTPDQFELDKLHLQRIALSTTEEEFAKYVTDLVGVVPEFTKFVRRDGIDWFFCFQKFVNEEEAAMALGALKDRSYKGAALNVMYARRKETMPSWTAARQQKLLEKESAKNASPQYGDYYQESLQMGAGDQAMSSPSQYRGRGGYGSNLSHRGFNSSQGQSQGPSERNVSAGMQYSSRGTAGSYRTRGGRTGYSRASLNHSASTNQTESAAGFSGSIQARIGNLDDVVEKDNSKAVMKGKSKVSEGSLFRICDLSFVDVRKPFKAECVKVNSYKDIVLQVRSLANEEIVHSDEYHSQRHQFFQNAGNSLGNVVKAMPGNLCLAHVAGVESDDPNEEPGFYRAVILWSGSYGVSSRPQGEEEEEGRGEGEEVSSGPVTVELIDVGLTVDVDKSKLFNIGKECVVNYPVSRLHGYFSTFEVDEAQRAFIVELLDDTLVKDLTAKDEVLYTAMRRVFNWVDIEVNVDPENTITKVLYETGDVLITEASMMWKRYPRLSPIQLKTNVQYIGSVSHLVSPKEMYVQVERLMTPAEDLSRKTQIECENMKHEAVVSALFDQMPTYEMAEIPNYKPFPFELVCILTPDGWRRANIVQFDKRSNEVDLFLVDLGTDMRVSADRLKPLPREFALTTEIMSPTSDISISDPTSTLIPALAAKVALSGASSEVMDAESLEQLKALVLNNKITLQPIKTQRRFSDEATQCKIHLLSNDEDSDSECNIDLLMLCVSKGIVRAHHPDQNDSDKTSVVSMGNNAFEPVAESTLRPGALSKNRTVTSAAVFDEDSSTQLSSDYVDIDQTTASETLHLVESLQEEVAFLRTKVETMEREMAELQGFKRSVTAHLEKFKRVFSE